jgi:(1->4)-alpha-D-glucan 1-alpha-D-glucosylmutase
VLLKIALPGVPDFYQGTELWDFSLVDPDNRRPIDFRTRRALWEDLNRAAEETLESLAREIAEKWPDQRMKLLVTRQALALRHKWPEVFNAGQYVPLEATGEKAEHLFAFARSHEGRCIIGVAPRHIYRLTHASSAATSKPPHAEWGDAELVLPVDAERTWRCELSGRVLEAQSDNDTLKLRAADLFEVLPVALLTAGERITAGKGF